MEDKDAIQKAYAVHTGIITAGLSLFKTLITSIQDSELNQVMLQSATSEIINATDEN